MIKLQKSGIPNVLSANGASWLTELTAAIASGDKAEIAKKKSRYNHKDIKSAAAAETHGKCAYCEADVRAVAHGDIEHVFPKSLDVSKTFDWSNLGFACQVCNQNKSNKDPIICNLIDPYTTDPEPYIVFYGHFINANGTNEGINTIHHLGLQRPPLVERRMEVFRQLIIHVESIKKTLDQSTRQILIDDFENNELHEKHEFSAMRRDFWKSFRP